jgi:prophage DNA circulation protein
MPAVSGGILVTAATIMTIYTGVSQVVRDIVAAKNHLTNLREGQMQDVWKSTTNADSNMFSQRMQELDNDIQQMLSTLDEYTALLQRSATEYQNTQQNVHNNANQLRSPTNR